MTGVCADVQSLSDQGNLANLSAFLQNAVLFIVATTHVIELTRSAITGNAGKCSLLLCPKVKDRLSTYSDARCISVTVMPCAAPVSIIQKDSATFIR